MTGSNSNPRSKSKSMLEQITDAAEDAAKATKSKLGSFTDRPDVKTKSQEHLDKLESTPAKAEGKIVLPRLDIRKIKINIVGDSSLIVHHWSEKAIKQMLDKQMGKASAGRELKDPQKDYETSLYIISPAPRGRPFEDSVFGFPAIAFKLAAVEACTSIGRQSITKVAARQAFHVMGELVTINGKPQMREDPVTVGQGTADLRYRGEFLTWSTELMIRYNARVLSDEQIVNLINTAGFAVGIGEWRSEKSGNHGLFHVE
jgi:hypothetical protein